MGLLGTKVHMSSSYHPQSNGLTEGVNRVMEDMLRHYVNPQQDDWDEYLDVAEFAINNSHNEGIKDTPFRMVYGQHPHTPLSVSLAKGVLVPEATAFAQRVHERVKQAQTALCDAQSRQKHYADTGRRDVTYKVDQQVLLSTKNIPLKTPGTMKLMPKWIGPFKITKVINAVACKLDLHENMKRIHNVFHVSKLRPYTSDGRYQPPPPPQMLENEEWFTVEALLEHRANRSKWDYLVKWRGYGPEHNQWLSSDSITDKAIADYWEAKGYEIPPPVAKKKSQKSH